MNTFIHYYKFPREPYLISHPNGQSLYPFSDQKGAKTLPFGEAHTYMAFMRQYPPPPPPPPPPGAAEHMLEEPVGKIPLSNGNDDR